MRAILAPEVEEFRIRKGLMASSRETDGNNGAFYLTRDGVEYFVVISDNLGWDHVSVSNPRVTPTWDVMCWIKDLFFEENELVLQFHLPKNQHTNTHQHCLHLWRPHNVSIPFPPQFMV